MLAFIAQSWLNFSLRGNDAKAFLKKDWIFNRKLHCKCDIIYYFLCRKRPLDIGPKYSNRFLLVHCLGKKSPHYSLFCSCIIDLHNQTVRGNEL